jgi:hypothetical protein
MIRERVDVLGGCREDPLTPTLSPRGEGAGCGPSTKERRADCVLSAKERGEFGRSLSPLGQGEGVFVTPSGRFA